MGLGADFAVGAEGAVAGSTIGATMGPLGAAVGGLMGFGLGFLIEDLFNTVHYTIKDSPKDTPKDKPGTPKPGPQPQPDDPNTDQPGLMNEYSGFAKPIRGLVKLYHQPRNPIPPIHIDTVMKRRITRIVLRDMANKRALEEIDTAYGRKRPGDMRPAKRRRYNPEVLRSVRRRLDLQGITDFAEEARRVWEDVQPFLPRH